MQTLAKCKLVLVEDNSAWEHNQPLNAQTTQSIDLCLGCLDPTDLVDDVERLIHKTVIPYLDSSDPHMHEYELRAECRAKLALIIDGGHLLRCPTRTKTFGFIKTVMRNHVWSLVQKIAFSQKRTGVEILPGRSTHTRGGGGRRTKLTRISLNDEDYKLRVGSPHSQRQPMARPVLFGP